jgi:hypothetical protein
LYHVPTPDKCKTSSLILVFYSMTDRDGFSDRLLVVS